MHCYADRKTVRPAYTDLQESRTEALTVWPGEPDDIAESYPSVRVADSAAVIDLFHGRERIKLVAPLASGKITRWARFSIGRPKDLLKRDGETWNDHSFHFNPAKRIQERSIKLFCAVRTRLKVGVTTMSVSTMRN